MIDKTKIINDIVQSLPTNAVKRIFLFGSCATETNKETSDIDLIVVSDCFEGINGYLRKKLFSSITDDAKLDIVCLSESEFDAFKNSDAYKKEYMELVYTGVLE